MSGNAETAAHHSRMRLRLLSVAAVFCVSCSGPSGPELAPRSAGGVRFSHSAGNGHGNGYGRGDHGNGNGPGHDDEGEDEPDEGGAVTTFAVDVSSLSGAEALAIDGSCKLVAKSLQDPAGAPLELVAIAADGTVGTPRTVSLRNSDLSGVAFDPLSGKLLATDEGGRRIVSLDPATGAIQGIATLPWTMNPASNGTGQHQFAADPDAALLYFWDSTRARLMRLDRLSGGLATVAALEPAIADGQHLQSFVNDVVFDPRSRTVLLSDSAGGRILEIDPRVVPATVATLVEGLVGPHALTLDPLSGELYVLVSFHTVLRISRDGAETSVLADGFTFLTDVVVCGGNVFVTDKSRDEIYRISTGADCPDED